MLVIIGYVIVLASVFGGYALVGGHFGVLFQPVELLIIGGAAVGAFIVANDKHTIIVTLKALPKLIVDTKKHDKALYMELLALLYVLLSKARKDGMMTLEADVDDPQNSAIFAPYTIILKDAHMMEFLTDYLRLLVGGHSDSFEISELMEHELQTFKHEAELPAHSLNRVGDALPALGIVAAVLGVVHALGSVDGPPAVLGGMIAAALVGTFLGVLMAYGFVSPLASLIEHKVAASMKAYECIKVTLMASLNGCAPQLAVEFGRKVLFSNDRPSFVELDKHVRELKNR